MIAAGAGRRPGLQPVIGDGPVTHLAGPVRAVVEAADGVLDPGQLRLDLVKYGVGVHRGQCYVGAMSAVRISHPDGPWLVEELVALGRHHCGLLATVPVPVLEAAARVREPLRVG